MDQRLIQWRWKLQQCGTLASLRWKGWSSQLTVWRTCWYSILRLSMHQSTVWMRPTYPFSISQVFILMRCQASKESLWSRTKSPYLSAKTFLLEKLDYLRSVHCRHLQILASHVLFNRMSWIYLSHLTISDSKSIYHLLWLKKILQLLIVHQILYL